jgi:hypothetical protein
MPKRINADAIALLREYAQRASLRGGNPYRVRAYARAADSLATLGEPLEDLIAQGRLTEIPDIGDAIATLHHDEPKGHAPHPRSRCAGTFLLESLNCWPSPACVRKKF